jgi:YesN/AraC family two-component response regulator
MDTEKFAASEIFSQTLKRQGEYVNTDHFSRMFKKYAGLAPKDFIMGRS